MNFTPKPFISLTAASGRIRLALQAEFIGCDLLVTLTGGAAHIGAVALADAAGIRGLQRMHHREGEIAENLAVILAGAFGCAVAAICGIHYDDISKNEIGEVLRLAAELRDALINWGSKAERPACQGDVRRLPKKVNAVCALEADMLTLEDLTKFEMELKSGKIEADFNYGDEKERGEILELLEKIMDVADVADEVATRLIFRGLAGAPKAPAAK